MAKLPQNLGLQQTQNTWATILEPIVSNPIVNGLILKSVTLASGSNTINHRLGRKLQGWYIVRQRSAASVYDTQDSNQTPELTLTLESSAAVTVDIGVF